MDIRKIFDSSIFIEYNLRMVKEFFGSAEQPGDIPRRKDTGANSEALSLSPETHGQIVRKIVSIMNKHDTFEITAGETFKFSNAVETGKIDNDHVVGSQFTNEYKHGKGPYSSFYMIDLWNESYGISDLPHGEKEVAHIGVLIDHEIDEMPNRWVDVHFSIKADSRITYTFTTAGVSSSEDTQTIEKELKSVGIDKQLQDEPEGKQVGTLNERQGRKLLEALRIINGDNVINQDEDI